MPDSPRPAFNSFDPDGNPPKTDNQAGPDFFPQRKLSILTQKVTDYIKTNYQIPLNTQTLEKELHYSYRYISKLFSYEMDMTPIDYIEKYKVFKAKELLKDTEFAIKYISKILSYPDVYQFSRVFKKNTGIPPGQWRDTAWSDICKDVVIHSGFENTLFIDRNSFQRSGAHI